MWQYNYTYPSELYHHGIKGQRWGVRRFQNKNGRLTGAGKKRYNEDDKTEEKSEKKTGLSKNQKRAIVIGASAVAAGLAIYGGYKLGKSGKLDALAQFGKKKAGGVPESSLKKLRKPESTSEALQKANPLRGTTEGKNNCVPSSMAGIMRLLGHAVTAKGTGGKQQLTAGVLEECFSGIRNNRSVLDGSAIKFGRSRNDAAKMITDRFGQNAKGVCAIDWKNRPGGHCFSWESKNGKVSFFDFQEGLDDGVVSNYWNSINPNGQLVLARLDDLKINADAIKKYIK